MMSSRRAVTALLEWWVEPTPRWAIVTGMPVAVALLVLLAWGLMAGQDSPPWLGDAALAVLLGGWMPLVLGGWIHSFVRVYRRAGRSAA